MKWTKEKINILEDGYKYRELEELALELGQLVKSATKKDILVDNYRK